MTNSDWISTVGVVLILAGFFALIMKWLSAESTWYLWLNAIGAGLACYGSFLIPSWPFVILEGVWSLVAFFGLIRKLKT
jgi:hypothetical protein